MSTRRKIERTNLKQQAETGQIEKLKAQAYDLISHIERAQAMLRQVNDQITALSQNHSIPAQPQPVGEPDTGQG